MLGEVNLPENPMIVCQHLKWMVLLQEIHLPLLCFALELNFLSIANWRSWDNLRSSSMKMGSLPAKEAAAPQQQSWITAVSPLVALQFVPHFDHVPFMIQFTGFTISFFEPANSHEQAALMYYAPRTVGPYFVYKTTLTLFRAVGYILYSWL